MTVVIARALTVHLASGRIQEGKQVSCAISLIVKLLKGRLISSCGQGGRQTFECSNARALIETLQVLWGIQIAFNDMLHFGKELRIGGL